MRETQNITNLVKALLQAHRSIPAAVIKNAENALYNSKYADLSAVVSAIKPHLLEAGIIVIQSPGGVDAAGNVSLTTRMLHESGEWIEDTLSMPTTFLDPHSYGTAVSFARRYALTAMFLLYQSDDDGNGACGHGRTPLELEQGRSGAASESSAPLALPSPSASTEAQQTLPSVDSFAPDIAKRLRSWLNTIENASLLRLEASRPTARVNFTGDALAIIEKAFDKRINKLKAESSATS